MQISEAIRQGSLKVFQLEEDQVQPRKKSMLMDAKIKKLENEIVQACRVNKLRIIGQDMGNHTTTLEDCHQAAVTLLQWL